MQDCGVEVGSVESSQARRNPQATTNAGLVTAVVGLRFWRQCCPENNEPSPRLYELEPKHEHLAYASGFRVTEYLGTGYVDGSVRDVDELSLA